VRKPVLTAKQLLDVNELREAETALNRRLRRNPVNGARRAVCFELLFLSQYERAAKQLGVLANGSREAEMGTTLFYSAIRAEWLGRGTAWAADDGGHEFPAGQKLLTADREEVPLLDIRSLEFVCDAAA